MHTSGEFRASTKKMILQLFICALLLLILVRCAIMPILAIIVYMGEKSNLLIHVGTPLRIVAILLGLMISSFFACSAIFVICRFPPNPLLFSARISVLGHAIHIIDKKVKCVIKKPDLQHILSCKCGFGDKLITLIWKTRDGLAVFDIPEAFFSKATLSELDDLLRRFKCYTDETKEIKNIRKHLGLEFLVKYNHYRYDLSRVDMKERT